MGQIGAAVTFDSTAMSAVVLPPLAQSNVRPGPRAATAAEPKAAATGAAGKTSSAATLLSRIPSVSNKAGEGAGEGPKYLFGNLSI